MLCLRFAADSPVALLCVLCFGIAEESAVACLLRTAKEGGKLSSAVCPEYARAAYSVFFAVNSSGIRSGRKI